MIPFRVIDTSDCNLEISDRVRLRRLFHLFNGVGNSLVAYGVLGVIIFIALVKNDPEFTIITLSSFWLVGLSVISFFMYQLTRAFFSRFGKSAIHELEARFIFLQIFISLYWGLSFMWFFAVAPKVSTMLIFLLTFMVSINLGFYLYSFRCYLISSLLTVTPSLIYLFFNVEQFQDLGILFTCYIISFFIYARHIIISVSSGVRLQTLNENLNRQLLVANKQLLEESSTDYLTGISNRRTLEIQLTREWARGLRQKYQIAVMIIDVDWFKKYNDHYGHLNGDDALTTIANTINTVLCRSGDFVARYGGEEFATVLSNTDQKAAMLLGNRLRDEVAALAIPHKLSDYGHLTISIGVYAANPSREGKPHDLFKRADVALYAAKAEGRNRTVCYDSAMEADAPSSSS